MKSVSCVSPAISSGSCSSLFSETSSCVRRFKLPTACHACTHRYIQCRINANRGPWQLLFARGPLLTRDRDLSKLYACERVDTRQWHEWHSQPLESTRHAGNYFVPISIRPIFIFFVAEVMSNYLTTDGLKKFSQLPKAP